MIRKKSGEIVKPSLKRRSTSTPGSCAPSDSEQYSPHEHDSYWSRAAKSAPATPFEDGLPSAGEKKTLRFAGGEDGEGGELEKVVLFKREHKVTAVTRALEGEDINGLEGTDTETENEGYRFSFHGASNVWNTRPGVVGSGASSPGAAPQEKIELRKEECSPVPRIEGLNLTAERRKIVLPAEHEHVLLENASLVDAGGELSLKGSIVVKNITFGKWVVVRFSKSAFSPCVFLCLVPRN